MVPIWAPVSSGNNMPTVYPVSHGRWDPGIHRGSVNEARGTASESSREKMEFNYEVWCFRKSHHGQAAFQLPPQKVGRTECLRQGRKKGRFFRGAPHQVNINRKGRFPLPQGSRPIFCPRGNAGTTVSGVQRDPWGPGDTSWVCSFNKRR